MCERRAGGGGGGGALVGAHRLEWLAVMSSSSLSHWYVTVRFSSHTKRSTSSSSAAVAIAGPAVALQAGAATFARLGRLGDAVAVALRGKLAGVAAGRSGEAGWGTAVCASVCVVPEPALQRGRLSLCFGSTEANPLPPAASSQFG